MKSIQFLDAVAILHMHEALLEEWGGEEGGGHRGADYEGVDAAVQAVKNSYYEGIEELAAAYAVYIVQGHVFMDGNKRAGSAAMTTFLVANGHSSGFAKGKLWPLMVELQERAERGEDAGKLVRWLAGKIRLR